MGEGEQKWIYCYEAWHRRGVEQGVFSVKHLLNDHYIVTAKHNYFMAKLRFFAEKCDSKLFLTYLIPIKIRAPLIFAHLAARKLKGASSRSTNARILKGEEKVPQMNKKNDKFTVK